MNSIPAKEIKRRGISSVDKLLKKGPVHVISNNRPAYVILSQESYARRQGRQSHESVWDWLSRPSLATRSRKQIDADLAKERASWGAG